MRFKFWKYHGTGNDFIMTDMRQHSALPDSQAIRRMCDRRFGIGADGLIIIGIAEGYDFSMSYFNSDGMESSMCGNGGRCAIAFADFLSPSPGPYHFLAIDGPHSGQVLGKSGANSEVKLKMTDVHIMNYRGQDIILDTGSPHLVRFTDHVSEIDVVGEGRATRFHPDFVADGINVNFAEKIGNHLFVRTYERGVEDETLSCGTGVTAVSLAYADRQKLNGGPLEIQTPGGRLQVDFRKDNSGFSDIWLSGPAVRVFEGIIEI